jgi:hypothetical protein
MSFFRLGVERKGGIFMSRTYHHGKERRIRVRGERRPTDVRRLARALIELEYQAAQDEAAAEVEHRRKREAKRKKGKPKGNQEASE